MSSWGTGWGAVGREIAWEGRVVSWMAVVDMVMVMVLKKGV